MKNPTHFLMAHLPLPNFLLLCWLMAGCDQTTPKHQWQLNVFNPGSNQTSTISESSVSHQLLVINYWAEWCKPCREEIPELNHFAQAEQNHVVVLGVNFDDKQSAALQEAVHKLGITFPVTTSNPATLFSLPEITGLPTTLILDEHGVLKEQLPGPQTLNSLEAALLRNNTGKR